MGAVYSANDTTLGNQVVALKTILPEHDRSGVAVQRFKREVQYARMITHPNVCRIFDVGYHDSGDPDRPVIFVTMEYLEGETLWMFLRDSGPLLPAQALPIVRQLADGLGAAHVAEIVHRDFKSPNVMIVPGKSGPRAVITDFGLARLVENANFETALTKKGQFVGSPLYIAPEQIEGNAISTATDVYAFGVVLYEMLTGKYPFTGSTAMATAMRRLHEPPTPPRAYLPSIDRQWEDVILRCLARLPEDRFQSMGDVMRALQPVPLRQDAATVPTPAPVPQKPPRKRGSLAAGIICALVLAIAIGTMWKRQWGIPFIDDLRTTAQEAFDKGKYVQARRLFEQAVSGGDADAQVPLGATLAMCLGGPCDIARSEKLLQEAAARGSHEAEAWLGHVMFIRGGSDARALELARSAAEQENAIAYYVIGRGYEHGRGVPKDDADADRYYALALPQLQEMATAGHPYGQTAVANLYLRGMPSLPKNEAAAVELYRKAAERDYPAAQVNLAGLYEEGTAGLPKDENRARTLYQKAAERRHPVALNRLGYCYSDGCLGLLKNAQKAAAYYQSAADQGLVTAINNLATFYYDGTGGMPKNRAKAAELMRKGADLGDAMAQTNLGSMYRDGEGGLPKDLSKAVAFYSSAAEQGNSYARDRLGRLYEDGLGVTRDYAKAVELYRAAGDEGQTNLGRMYALGRGVLKDEARAVELYGKAAARGESAAQYNLAFRYEHGTGGLAKNEGKAVELYFASANRGHAGAQFKVAAMYADGTHGIAKDEVTAATWLRESADKGDAGAQYRLALFHSAGLGGVEHSEARAVELYRLSADQGHTMAQNNLGTYHYNGTGGLTKNVAKAAELFHKAAAQGNDAASFNLGLVYENGGDGVTRNLDEAQKWYRTAANMNYERARQALTRLGIK